MIWPYSKDIRPPRLVAPFRRDWISVDQLVELLVAQRRPLDLGPGGGILRVVTRLALDEQEPTVVGDGDQVERLLEYLDQPREIAVLDDKAGILGDLSPEQAPLNPVNGNGQRHAR